MMAPVGKVIIRRAVPGDASGIARVCAEGWRFRYHPDPLATGMIVASGEGCVVCEQARGYLYAGIPFARKWSRRSPSAHGASLMDPLMRASRRSSSMQPPSAPG
jgi:hypothetical protein